MVLVLHECPLKKVIKKTVFAITGSKEKYEFEPKSGYQTGKHFFKNRTIT
jgi:hypothetical protein